MVGALKVLRREFWKHWGIRRQTVNAILVALVVLMMFYAMLLEIGAWSLLYLATGAFSHIEPAFYFSAVTYTTVGYGDIVLRDHWRVLSSLQAANGIIMFGWTTALIVAFVHRLYLSGGMSQDEDE